ncbi:hypothetical protein ACTFIW_012882 [Dictyostelium discoideum]
MAIQVAMIIFDGFEEIECVTTLDLLRRANIRVDLISIDNEKKSIKGSHYIELVTEYKFQDFIETLSNYNGIIIPGGPGIVQQLTNQKLIDAIKRFGLLYSNEINNNNNNNSNNNIENNNNNRFLAAICAAPQIFGKCGLLKGRKVTHFPGCNQFMQDSIELLDQTVVVDGNIITASSAGVTVPFALKIVEFLKGIDASNLLYSQINPIQVKSS